MADDVDADPDDQPVEILPCASLRLEEDAGKLLSVEEDIVGPFAAQLGAGWRDGGDCVAEAERADETELSCRRRRAIRSQDEGDEEVALYSDSLVSSPAIALRLLLRPFDRAPFRPLT